MGFSTKECEFKRISIDFNGRVITGLRGIEFKKSIEKEHLYGAGSKPIDIQEGNEEPSGTLTLLKHEVDILNDAAIAAGYADITEVPHELFSLTCSFKKRLTDRIRYISVVGMAFTDLTVAMEQNSKFAEVPLPFLAMDIIYS